MYHILLFYKFTKIPHPEQEVELHKEVCKALNLTGRILLNATGINGTVGGSKECIELYKQYMNNHRSLHGIDFKESVSDIPPFPKMRIRFRKEIITTEASGEFSLCNTGKHVDRDTFHKWLVNKEDMVILDMRNDFEWEIGRFVNSVRPPMKYFRELKESMDFYEQFRGKKIVMFCTGGIRCEPASAYFIAKGFDPQTIYQLEGGIVKYAEKYGNDGFYEGKCYVFDERVAVPVNTSDTAVIVGSCYHCKKPCDTYRNCVNKVCNLMIISCNDCAKEFELTCSRTCQEIIKDEKNVRPLQARHVTTSDD